MIAFSNQKAFTLVELAIVLVIIGLVIGVVLTGKDLMRAAEINTAIKEYDKYNTAIMTFKLKYGGYPGDITKATDYWGKDTAQCPFDTGAVSATGTCNGDGNLLLQQGAANGTSENFQFWRQLSLAGLIEGKIYSGVAGPVNGMDSIVGTNVPAAKLAGAGWSVRNLGDYAGGVNEYAYYYGNTLVFGGEKSGYYTIDTVLTPQESMIFDTKVDDGMPGSGKLIARSAFGWGSANACTTSTGFSDYTGKYRTANSKQACSLTFVRIF